MKLRILAILFVALLAGISGLVVSMGVGRSGLFAGTFIGRWFGERPVQAPEPMGAVPAVVGENIGYLSLTDLQGRPQALPSAPGRLTLVNVWASWCVPCRDEMPLLDQFAKSQGDKGVMVVGVAEDEAFAVHNYVRDVPVAYPILLDDAHWRAGTRLGNQKGVLPFTALIDADGRLIRSQYGPFADMSELQQWAKAP